MNVSVVVVTYRRLAHMEKILAAWLRSTPDVWLCDCTAEGFKTALPVNIVRAVPDPGNKIRHAVALLTAGDLVIKADDDIMPRGGLVNDFASAYQRRGDAIYGIHGRRFYGPSYYAQNHTKLFGPKSTKQLTEVDFVGIITAAPRKFLPMDLRGCHSAIEDLHWQMRCYPKVKKYVIPTNNVIFLPECMEKSSLSLAPQSKAIRSRYYEEFYKLHYKDKKWATS